MNDLDLAEELRRFLDGFGPYDRRHTAVLFSELADHPAQGRRHLVAALVAGLLALALTATLLVAGHRPAGTPAAHRASPASRPTPVTTATPTPTRGQASFSDGDLQAASLGNVAGLVQRLDVAAAGGGQTAHLVGVYGDAARTVFLVQGLPPAAAGGQHLSWAVSDGGGLVNASQLSGPTPSGGEFLSLDAGLRPGPDGMDQVTLQVGQETSAGPTGRITTANTWSFAVAVRVVTRVTTLAAPAAVVAGGRTYALATVRETPNVVQVVAVVAGAGVQDVTGNPPVAAPLTLTDPSGTSLTPVSMGVTATGAGGTPGAQVEGVWPRGAPGTYRLTITDPGGAQQSGSLQVS